MLSPNSDHQTFIISSKIIAKFLRWQFFNVFPITKQVNVQVISMLLNGSVCWHFSVSDRNRSSHCFQLEHTDKLTPSQDFSRVQPALWNKWYMNEFIKGSDCTVKQMNEWIHKITSTATTTSIITTKVEAIVWSKRRWCKIHQ